MLTFSPTKTCLLRVRFLWAGESLLLFGFPGTALAAKGRAVLVCLVSALGFGFMMFMMVLSSSSNPILFPPFGA